MKTLLLSRADVASCLTARGVIEAVKEGYKAFEAGEVRQPDVVSIEIPEYNGETDIKSSYSCITKMESVKIASGFYDNGKTNGYPTMIGTVLLYDGTDGMPLCIMDGSLITGIRTGAAGAVSCEYLSREDSDAVAVIGCGGQAEMQIEALMEVRDIKRINVYGRRPEAAVAYKAKIEKRFGVDAAVFEDAASAARGADIVITVTPSKDWLIPASAIVEGTHIVAVGADMAGKNELEPSVFRGAKVVCDSIAQCVYRGETRNAVEAGVIGEDDIYAQIGEIVNGSRPGRTDDSEITIFDTTGMGIQDNVTAEAVYREALRRGLGTYFEFI